MKRLVFSGIILCTTAITLVLGGCGRGADSWQAQIQSTDNPDLRRESVLEMMELRVGKSDAAVQLFAKLAKSDPEPTVQSAAVQALGKSGNAKAVAPLAWILTNETNTQVRTDAAVALGTTRGPGAVGPLRGRLHEDPAPEVQAACARTLGKYPYPSVVQTLIVAMRNDDFSVVFEAQQSLNKLTGVSFQTSRAWQDWLVKNGDPFAATTGSAKAAK